MPPTFGVFRDAYITEGDLAAGLTADQIARLKDKIKVAVGKAYTMGYKDGHGEGYRLGLWGPVVDADGFGAGVER